GVAALMCADGVQDRVASARIEVRADPREVQWRSDERLAEAVAVRGVVVGAPVRVAISSRSICLALVHELGRDDLAVAQLDAVPPDLLVENGELIAVANVLNEIDVPLEDAREVHDELVRHARLHSGFEQRRSNGSVSSDRAQFDLALERARLELGPFAGECYHGEVLHTPRHAHEIQ